MRATSQLPGKEPTDVDQMFLHLHINLNADDDDDIFRTKKCWRFFL